MSRDRRAFWIGFVIAASLWLIVSWIDALFIPDNPVGDTILAAIVNTFITAPLFGLVLGAVAVGLVKSIAVSPRIFEFLVTIGIRLMYAFAGVSVEEVILKRRERKMAEEKAKAYRREREQYLKEKRETDRMIKERQRELARIQRRYPRIIEDVPEVLEYLSDELEYRGYLGEIERRFQEGQIRKSIKERKETIAASRKLVEELAELRRSRVTLARAFYESEAEERKLVVKRRRMEEGEIEELAAMEMDIEKLKLRREKEQLERALREEELRQKVERARAERELKRLSGEGESPKERLGRRLERLKAELETKAEATVIEAKTEVGVKLKLREAAKEVLKERFGERNREDLDEEEREEYDFIVAFFWRKMDEI